jgi:hypothetical protein
MIRNILITFTPLEKNLLYYQKSQLKPDDNDMKRNYLKCDTKIGSFGKLWMCVGLCGFANVPMCDWLKLFFKMCGGKNF